MSVQFFNFGNDETFHFFQWICQSVHGGPDALIEEAFTQAEEVNDMEFPAEDICEIVKNRLTAKLEDILTVTAPDLAPNTNLWWEVGVIPPDDQGGPSADMLLMPILGLALQRIDCRTAAEALLIRAGKWSPSKQPPEIL